MSSPVVHRTCAPSSSLSGTAGVLLAFAYLVGTGGDNSLAYLAKRQDQGYRFIRIEDAPYRSSGSTQFYARTAAETISRIQEVLKFSISDLAVACNVSRQSVYKWISGNSVSLQPENQSRLDDIYRAAEVFVRNNVIGSAALLKRTDSSGMTLVEAARAGRSVLAWAQEMIETLKLESEQRATLDARLRARKHTPSAAQDWGVPIMRESDY